VIEPVAQIVWTGDQALTDRPAEESRQVAFDEGNLFSFSRFPAGDRVESGVRANLGLSYTRHDPGGWSLGLTAGRVVRADDAGQFAGVDALEGARSDWLLAARLDLAQGLSVDGRALVDEDLDAGLIEAQFGWAGERLDFAGTYTWLEADPAEARPEAVNQWRVDGALRWNDRWSASADIAYDLARDRAADATFGVEYRGNCVTVDVGLRQRYTDPGQDAPSTSLDFGIELAGFGGTDGGPRPRNRACLR
jgi:LPS-assembly protein